MSPKDILFSVNEYSKDGNCSEEGIFLHFCDTKVKAADTLDAFKGIIPHLQSIIEEIEENYPECKVQP